MKTLERQWGLPNLPFEIVYDILSRLPVKSLCRFKSVSNPWLALITDPEFVKSHLHHQSTNANNISLKIILCSFISPFCCSVYYQAPDHIVAQLEMPCKSGAEIFGSLNGVLLLDIDIDEELCLWNPSIRMYQKFSPPKCPDDRIDGKIYGLGYDSISDDFKVVAAFFLVSGAGSVVHVFSSKLSLWKRIGVFRYTRYLYGLGCVLNGAPHWLVHGNADVYFHIACFDVTEEKFKELPKPIDEVEDDQFTLGVLGGWLCVVDHRLESHSDVWVMKEYGVKESWTKLFVLPNVPGEFFFDYFDMLCFKDGEVVIMLQPNELLVVYNAKQKTFKTIGIPQDCKPFEVALYVESLVSPHGCNNARRH